LTTQSQIIHKIRTFPLEQAFYYIQGLLNAEKDAWQYWDMLQAIKLKEAVWVRSRGGSKTDDAAQLAVILGLRYGNGGWYTGEGGQLEEARLRLMDYDPWITSVNERRALLCTGDRIIFGNYSGKRGLRGPRNKWIISDEEGEIFQDRKILKGYEGALGTTSTYPNAIKLHMGTPKIGSKLQENAERFPTFSRDPSYCHWVNVAQYDHMPQWWKDNELYCKWTAPGGGVFSPITQFHFPTTFDRVTQGVDFNGSTNNNIGVRIGWIGYDTYILKEDTFQYKLDDSLLQQYCNQFPTNVESGGWNTTFAPNLIGVSKSQFTKEKNQLGLKEQIITDMNKGNIYCLPSLTPKTYKHIMSAVWSKDRTVEVNDLHYLAAVLHGRMVAQWGQGQVFKGGFN
jgi:hypothetical protein